MTRGRLLTALGAVLAAVLAMGLAVLLILSLRMQFSPKPTEYPNSEWVSEDGVMSLSVGEYDSEVYQCRAVLTVTSEDGTTASYEVSDGAYSSIYLLEGDKTADQWIRVKCNADGFTVRVNRSGGYACAGIYGQNEKVAFKRVK